MNDLIGRKKDEGFNRFTRDVAKQAELYRMSSAFHGTSIVIVLIGIKSMNMIRLKKESQNMRAQNSRCTNKKIARTRYEE